MYWRLFLGPTLVDYFGYPGIHPHTQKGHHDPDITLIQVVDLDRAQHENIQQTHSCPKSAPHLVLDITSVEFDHQY